MWIKSNFATSCCKISYRIIYCFLLSSSGLSRVIKVVYHVKIYLKEEDLLKDTDFPIIAHLNEASNSDFILFLQNLNNGTGSGYEYTCSNFWDDLDEYDKSQIEKFEGLEIGTQADEEIILSYDDLLYYIKLIRKRIITVKESAGVLDKLISNLSKKYVEK